MEADTDFHELASALIMAALCAKNIENDSLDFDTTKVRKLANFANRAALILEKEISEG